MDLTLLVSLALAAPVAWLAARLTGRFAGRAAGPRLTGAMAAGFALLTLWAAWVTPPGPILAASLVLGWMLATLAIIDGLTLRLPDLLTGPLVAAGLATCCWLPGRPVLHHLIGAAGGYLVPILLRWAYRRLRGREGLGAGDAKLLGAAGAWLGWAPLFSVAVIASLAALASVGLAAILGRRKPGAVLPYGPFLCLAVWLVWLYGPLTLLGG